MGNCLTHAQSLAQWPGGLYSHHACCTISVVSIFCTEGNYSAPFFSETEPLLPVLSSTQVVFVILLMSRSPPNVFLTQITWGRTMKNQSRHVLLTKQLFWLRLRAMTRQMTMLLLPMLLMLEEVILMLRPIGGLGHCWGCLCIDKGDGRPGSKG